jgi:hypothetical protein
MQRLCGSNAQNCGPLHLNLPGKLALDYQLFIVRFQYLTTNAIAIGQNDLICEQYQWKRKDKDEDCCYVEDAQLGHNCLLGKSISLLWLEKRG